MKETQKVRMIQKEYSKNRQENGITLIALVVTIIVMLILAGITIQTTIGDGGIIDLAKQSKEEQLIASYKDRIGIVGINWSLNRALDDSVTIDGLWQDMQDVKIINNKETDVEKVDERGNYIITVPEGYKFHIHINEYDDVEIDYIGKEDELLPYINEITVISQTTNSVELQVSVSRLNGGTLNYYYKEKGESDENYQLIKRDTTELTASIRGLTDKTTYEIKVEATNENGTTEKITEVFIGELKGSITQKGETIWSNGTASIHLETEAQNLSILYQINSIEETYQTYDDTKGITGLEHGDTVFAVLSDGTNITDYTSIDALDKLGPTVTVTQESKNTNSIQVNASSSDAEWGMPDSITYNYYIKKTADGNYPQDPIHTGTEMSYTFTGLIQNTSYDVKVTTSDKAGNEGEWQVTNITTDTVGEAGDDLKEGNIVASEPTWQNGTASITLSKGTGVDSYLTIQYQVGDIAEGNWTTAQEGATSVTVTGLSHNNVVYARLTDGTNYGNYASVAILDKLPPQNAKIELSGQSTTTTGSITATVMHIDNESEVEATNCRWVYNTNSNPIGTEISSYPNTFGSNGQRITLSASNPGTYYLHVLTVDKAENKIETISQPITVIQLVTGITLNQTNVTLTEEDTIQLTATITPSNANNQTVTWSSNNDAIASVSSAGLVTAKTAGTVAITVRTNDGSNISTTCSIKVKTKPVPIENILEEGNYVTYMDGTGVPRNCMVLYGPENPNYSIYGIQIITMKTVEDVTLGEDDNDIITAKSMNDYNDVINILNNATIKYLNTTYADKVRCVGSVPNNPSYDGAGMFTRSDSWFSSYNGKLKNEDENYSMDYDQISKLGLRVADKGFWLASRGVYSISHRTYFMVHTISSSGVRSGNYLCYLESNGSTYSDSATNGLRPVFHLKSGLKVTGGNGTSDNPYTLGK